MNEKSNASPGPSEVRGISDPPDMGRLKPAEEEARELVSPINVALSMAGPDAYHFSVGGVSCAYNDPGHAKANRKVAIAMLSGIIEQRRAEGASGALGALNDVAKFCEDRAGEYESKAADAWCHEASSERAAGSAEAFGLIASLLRARAKGISDPPDMG